MRPPARPLPRLVPATKTSERARSSAACRSARSRPSSRPVSRPGPLTQQIDPVVAERRTRGLHIVDLRRDAVAAKIETFGGEPVGAGPGCELSHVCAGGDLDGELGIEGLGETVKHPKTRYGAASFKPSYG